MRHAVRMRRTVVLCAAVCVVVSACTSAGPTTPASTPATSTNAPAAHSSRVPSSTAPTTAAPSASGSKSGATQSPDTSTQTPAQRALAAMTLRERVGQLLMVDCPSSGVASATVTAIRTYHVGAVILDGNSTLGVTRTHAITAQLQSDAPRGTGLLISTDQEGGLVQRMRGPGFSSVPSAVQQGMIAPSRLRTDAAIWGRQLRRAGINVDLAPVLDTVPPGNRSNPPIGDLDREYGRTPAAVTSHGVAVARGLADARMDATVKHFPGLGRVASNTDTTSGVTDSVTTRHDAYLAPFAAAVRAHVPFVMMSTAIYSRIVPGKPAAFSSTVITGMLRGDLGFTGVVISDDLGAAKQVGRYSVGTRAVRFIAAGGDMVLTVVASQAATMTAALVAEARRSPVFRAKVNAAALRVLQAKQARGLLS